MDLDDVDGGKGKDGGIGRERRRKRNSLHACLTMAAQQINHSVRYQDLGQPLQMEKRKTSAKEENV
jgi:hypothetical protein